MRSASSAWLRPLNRQQLDHVLVDRGVSTLSVKVSRYRLTLHRYVR